MSIPIEREIRLRFESLDTARIAVHKVGATALRSRRLQDDRLVDWADGRLRESRCVLRIRKEDGAVTLTFKGPPKLAVMKVREELETVVDEAEVLLTILDRLGLRVWFRYQKFREEYELPGLILAIDETPIGMFVELEGEEHAIEETAHSMGRTPVDYVLESYRGLFVKDRKARGLPITDMIFEDSL